MSKSTDPVRAAAANLAQTLRRDRPRDPEVVARARDALLAARLHRAVGEALAPSDPAFAPLSEDERREAAGRLLEGLP